MKRRPRTKPAPGPNDRLQLIAGVAVICIVIALIYLPAFQAGFVWDDDLLITGNPLLRNISGLGEIWSGGRTPDYFPVTNTLFWIEWHLFGANATGYHAINVLLQMANALLIWLVLRRLDVPGAWLAAFIFGIHPIHVESVAWISELKNLLSMFFGLLCVICFLAVERKPHRSFFALYFGSLVFFILALLSKTQIVFLPALLLVWVWWRSRRAGASRHGRVDFQDQISRIAPFFVIALLFGLVTVWFQNRGLGGEHVVLGSFARRTANAAMAIWWYTGKVFVPFPLMPIYPPWRFGFPTPVEWLPLLALLVVLGVLWRFRALVTAAPFAALVCFILALAPVLGFLQMAYVRSGALVADHFQYLADIFLIALVSAGLARLWQRGFKIAISAVVPVLSVAMGAYTWIRAATYHDEETLWRDNLARNPDAWQAHYRLGQRSFQRQNYVEALHHFERAAQLKPELGDNHNQLGLAYCRLERFDEGIAEYRKALQLKEAQGSAANRASVAKIEANLANALAITASNMMEEAGSSVIGSAAPGKAAEAGRRSEEAVEAYEKSLELDPSQPGVHRNFGLLLVRLGRLDEAAKELRRTLEIVPNEPVARETLDALGLERR